MSVAPLISVGPGRLTPGVKSLSIPACKCFSFFLPFYFSSPFLMFYKGSKMKNGNRKELPSSGGQRTRFATPGWAGSQWHRSGCNFVPHLHTRLHQLGVQNSYLHIQHLLIPRPQGAVGWRPQGISPSKKYFQVPYVNLSARSGGRC